MATYKALRYHGPKNLQLTELTQKPCGIDEVRLQVAYCGLCGSDLHEYLGGPIFPPKAGEVHPHTGVSLPVTLGHEMSGTVTEVGSKVTGFVVGQNVVVNPALNDLHYGLPSCSVCSTGKYNLCPKTSYYGLSADGGGLADEIVVKSVACIPLPDGVPLDVGALAEPLAVAWHCIRTAGFQKGQTALVLGAGPIGLALLLLLKVWGAKAVVVSEVASVRRELANDFGADAVINPLEGSILDLVASFSSEGADVVFDAIGLQSTLDTALKAVRPAGTIFNVAIHEKPLLLNLNDISIRETKLLGGICYTREDFDGVLGVLASKSIPAERLITSIVPLSRAVEGGFLELINNKAKHVKILIQPDSRASRL